MKDKETGFKAITKSRLLEILSELPDNILISAQSIARTGNLTVYKGTWPDEEDYGYIDLTEDIFKPMWSSGNDLDRFKSTCNSFGKE